MIRIKMSIMLITIFISNACIKKESIPLEKVPGSGFRVIDGDPEPKHPGEKGKETVIGIDEDNDGVRDDIEIWINSNVQNPNIRKAFKQSTRYHQLLAEEFLPPKVDQLPRYKAIHTAFFKADWAMRCGFEISVLADPINGIDNYNKIHSQFWKQYINTKARREIELEGMKKTDQSTSVEIKIMGTDIYSNIGRSNLEYCEFEVK